MDKSPEPHATLLNMDLNAVAVVLHLMSPTGATSRLCYNDCPAAASRVWRPTSRLVRAIPP